MKNIISALLKNLYSLIFTVFIAASFSFAQTKTTPEQTIEASTSPSPVSPATEPQTAVVPASVEPPIIASKYVSKEAAARIPRFETAPVIDGQLNDEIWRNAAVFGDFVQISPGDNVKPTHPTEFMMGYDAKNLYLAFRIKQDRDKVRATLSRRDNIFNDDYVLGSSRYF
jgi:hypothetical protein